MCKYCKKPFGNAHVQETFPEFIQLCYNCHPINKDSSLKPKGNGRWFYFWANALPDKMFEYLAEYGNTTVEEIKSRNLDRYQLHDYAESVGLIENHSDFDRSPLNDAVAFGAKNTVDYLQEWKTNRK